MADIRFSFNDFYSKCSEEIQLNFIFWWTAESFTSSFHPFKSTSIHFASWNNSPLEIFNKLHLCTWVQWTSTWLHGSLNVFIKVFWIRSGRIKRSVANCVQDLPACTTPNYSSNLFVMMWLLAVTRCTSHVAAGKWKAYVDQGNFVRTQTAERSEMNRRPPRTRRFDLFIFKKIDSIEMK